MKKTIFTLLLSLCLALSLLVGLPSRDRAAAASVDVNNTADLRVALAGTADVINLKYVATSPNAYSVDDSVAMYRIRITRPVTLISTEGAVLTSADAKNFICIESDNVTIQGLTFKSTGTAACWGIETSGNISDVNVTGCTFLGSNMRAAYYNPGAEGVISNNTLGTAAEPILRGIGAEVVEGTTAIEISGNTINSSVPLDLRVVDSTNTSIVINDADFADFTVSGNQAHSGQAIVFNAVNMNFFHAHEAILTRALASIARTDVVAVKAALDYYTTLSAEDKALLSAEKAKLEGFMARIKGLIEADIADLCDDLDIDAAYNLLPADIDDRIADLENDIAKLNAANAIAANHANALAFIKRFVAAFRYIDNATIYTPSNVAITAEDKEEMFGYLFDTLVDYRDGLYGTPLVSTNADGEYILADTNGPLLLERQELRNTIRAFFGQLDPADYTANRYNVGLVNVYNEAMDDILDMNNSNGNISIHRAFLVGVRKIQLEELYAGLIQGDFLPSRWTTVSTTYQNARRDIENGQNESVSLDDINNIYITAVKKLVGLMLDEYMDSLNQSDFSIDNWKDIQDIYNHATTGAKKAIADAAPDASLPNCAKVIYAIEIDAIARITKIRIAQLVLTIKAEFVNPYNGDANYSAASITTLISNIGTRKNELDTIENTAIGELSAPATKADINKAYLKVLIDVNLVRFAYLKNVIEANTVFGKKYSTATAAVNYEENDTTSNNNSIFATTGTTLGTHTVGVNNLTSMKATNPTSNAAFGSVLNNYINIINGYRTDAFAATDPNWSKQASQTLQTSFHRYYVANFNLSAYSSANQTALTTIFSECMTYLKAYTGKTAIEMYNRMQEYIYDLKTVETIALKNAKDQYIKELNDYVDEVLRTMIPTFFNQTEIDNIIAIRDKAIEDIRAARSLDDQTTVKGNEKGIKTIDEEARVAIAAIETKRARIYYVELLDQYYATLREQDFDANRWSNTSLNGVNDLYVKARYNISFAENREAARRLYETYRDDVGAYQVAQAKETYKKLLDNYWNALNTGTLNSTDLTAIQGIYSTAKNNIDLVTVLTADGTEKYTKAIAKIKDIYDTAFASLNSTVGPKQADWFKEKYARLIAKDGSGNYTLNVGNVEIADRTAADGVDNALLDFAKLTPAAQAILAAEKTHVEQLKTQITYLENKVLANSFMTTYANILAKTVEDGPNKIAITDRTVVEGALGVYAGLSDAVKGILINEFNNPAAKLSALLSEINRLETVAARVTAKQVIDAHFNSLILAANLTETSEGYALFADAKAAAYELIEAAEDKASVGVAQNKGIVLLDKANAIYDLTIASYKSILGTHTWNLPVNETHYNDTVARAKADIEAATVITTSNVNTIRDEALSAMRDIVAADKNNNDYTDEARARKFKLDYADVLILVESTVGVTHKSRVLAALTEYATLNERVQTLLTDSKARLDILSVQIEVLEFRATHNEILGKTVATVLATDLAKVDAALADYAELSVAAQGKLTTEKTKLDALRDRVLVLRAAAAFRVKHGALLAKNLADLTFRDIPAINAAVAEFETLAPEVKTELADPEKLFLDAAKAKIEALLSAALADAIAEINRIFNSYNENHYYAADYEKMTEYHGTAKAEINKLTSTDVDLVEKLINIIETFERQMSDMFTKDQLNRLCSENLRLDAIIARTDLILEFGDEQAIWDIFNDYLDRLFVVGSNQDMEDAIVAFRTDIADYKQAKASEAAEALANAKTTAKNLLVRPTGADYTAADFDPIIDEYKALIDTATSTTLVTYYKDAGLAAIAAKKVVVDAAKALEDAKTTAKNLLVRPTGTDYTAADFDPIINEYKALIDTAASTTLVTYYKDAGLAAIAAKKVVVDAAKALETAKTTAKNALVRPTGTDYTAADFDPIINEYKALIDTATSTTLIDSYKTSGLAAIEAKKAAVDAAKNLATAKTTAKNALVRPTGADYTAADFDPIINEYKALIDTATSSAQVDSFKTMGQSAIAAKKAAVDAAKVAAAAQTALEAAINNAKGDAEDYLLDILRNFNSQTAMFTATDAQLLTTIKSYGYSDDNAAAILAMYKDYLAAIENAASEAELAVYKANLTANVQSVTAAQELANEIDDNKIVPVDTTAANAVVSKITTLLKNTNATQADIDAVRSDYDKLSVQLKTYVTNYADFVNYEANFGVEEPGNDGLGTIKILAIIALVLAIIAVVGAAFLFVKNSKKDN